MATFVRAGAALPAKDFERAKSWYADKLGLKPVQEMGDQGSYYEVGDSRFMLYPSQFAGTNQATAMGLEVDDVEATVAELRSAGVEFAEYDFPGLKTVDGVATMEADGHTLKSAWCTDSEGNIIAIANAWRD
ncbi:MAG TPA: VOC family protein [Longimicrobiales bacterium]|jgi:catechol 2,3-dioxygenase-like lactoylglutathione lyase family enzyme